MTQTTDELIAALRQAEENEAYLARRYAQVCRSNVELHAQLDELQTAVADITPWLESSLESPLRAPHPEYEQVSRRIIGLMDQRNRDDRPTD